MTDIITAMRRYIVDTLGPQSCSAHEHAPVVADLSRPSRGTRPFQMIDHFGVESSVGRWVFQERLLARVEGSSSATPLPVPSPVALVLSHRGAWTAPNEHNTMSFPRLEAVYYADPERDANGNVTDSLSARDAIQGAHEAVDFHLHRFHFTGAKSIGGTETQPGVRLLRCTRLGEPAFAMVPEGGGVLSASVFYALGVG